MTDPSQSGRQKTLLTSVEPPRKRPAAVSPRSDPREDRVSLWRVLTAAWQQHRLTLLFTGAAVLVVTAAVTTISEIGTPEDGALSVSAVQLTLLLVDTYALGVGVFQAAPLLAREYEHRTHLFAWSQDVSPTRWLTGQTVLLLAVAVVSALLLGAATQRLVLATPGTRDFAFEVPYFDASPIVQVGHVVFAFALGLAVGLLFRRSVPAMSVTFVGYLAVRIGAAYGARPHYLPPVRQIVPLGQSGTGTGLTVDFGYLTVDGQPVAVPQECTRTGSGDFLDCMGRYDIVGYYLDGQPIDRLLTFQLVETGIALALALALAAVTVAALRRTTRG